MKLSQGAFPNHSDAPSGVLQRSALATVADDVSLEFSRPELDPALWAVAQHATGVTVPEAAVYEDNGLVSRQHQIGTARKIPRMQPVAEPCGMKQLPKLFFRACILSPNTLHVAAALCRRKSICHA
jgi:hypothetical protein